MSVGGYSATVSSLEFVQRLNDFEDDGYMVAEIEITNDSSRALPYNTFDWRIQTPNGQVLDPGMHDNIGSGDLVPGGNVTGQVVWDVGSDVSGEYYIIFKPSAWDAARGIWGKEF